MWQAAKAHQAAIFIHCQWEYCAQLATLLIQPCLGAKMLEDEGLLSVDPKLFNRPEALQRRAEPRCEPLRIRPARALCIH